MADSLAESAITTRGMSAVLLLRALVESARAAGIDRDRLLAAIGASVATLDDVNGWVSVDVMARAWQLVSEWSGDPDFGMHAAENMPPGTYGALEYATLSSTSLADALGRAVRYYRVLGAMSEQSIATRGALMHLSVTPQLPMTPLSRRHFVEHFFALLVTRARLLTGRGLALVRVRFAHAAPADVSEHARIFGAPVEFGQRGNELVADCAVLAEPLRTANPALVQPLEEAAASVLRRADEDVVARTRAELPRVLETGDPGLAAVARRLGIGARTLQRRLAQRGSSYADLVEEVRRELAHREVALGSKSFGEIAFLLGFSQASAFDRAFRRWTGATPSAYRRGRGRGR
jgi:AraC-like DNA-binding protein